VLVGFMSERLGSQLILDCWGCNEQVGSVVAVRAALEEVVQRVNATVLQLLVHEFHPQGVSALAVIAESHIFIHTWPEKSYLGLDVFTCGDNAMPENAVSVIMAAFQPTRHHLRTFDRGRLEDLAVRKE
jgi:S-adenosylmethionine decarboxylase